MILGRHAMNKPTAISHRLAASKIINAAAAMTGDTKLRCSKPPNAKSEREKRRDCDQSDDPCYDVQWQSKL